MSPVPPRPPPIGNRPVAINSFSGGFGVGFSRNRQPTAARGPPPKAYKKERSTVHAAQRLKQRTNFLHLPTGWVVRPSKIKYTTKNYLESVTALYIPYPVTWDTLIPPRRRTELPLGAAPWHG